MVSPCWPKKRTDDKAVCATGQHFGAISGGAAVSLVVVVYLLASTLLVAGIKLVTVPSAVVRILHNFFFSNNPKLVLMLEP
jgi:hypothetical protein